MMSIGWSSPFSNPVCLGMIAKRASDEAEVSFQDGGESQALWW
jgi:hypothetical protein